MRKIFIERTLKLFIASAMRVSNNPGPPWEDVAIEFNFHYSLPFVCNMSLQMHEYKERYDFSYVDFDCINLRAKLNS